MPDKHPERSDDLRHAARDALADFKADVETREIKKASRRAREKKNKALMLAFQYLLLLTSLVIIMFQAPRLVSSISRESKPIRIGTFETNRLTDACIQNLWKVSALLQQGKLPGKNLLCPASRKPFNIAEIEGNIVASSPRPGLYGFKAIQVSKKKPVPELIK